MSDLKKPAIEKKKRKKVIKKKKVKRNKIQKFFRKLRKKI